MKNLRLSLTLVATAALAFGAGRFSISSDESPASEPARRQDRPASEPAAAAYPAPAGRFEAASPAGARAVPAPSLESILANPDLAESMPQFERFLDSLSKENAHSALSKLLALPHSRQKTALTNRLFKKWGELDGAVAFETAQALEGGDRLRYLAQAAAGWSTTDMMSAWDSLMVASNEGALSQLPLGPMLREVAKQDVGLAMTLMSEAGGQGARGRFKAILGVAAENGQYQDVLSSLMANPEIEGKEQYVRALYEEWGKNDLNTPLQSLRALDDRALNGPAMAGIMRGWASVDGAGAFSYVLDNSDDPLVAKTLPSIARELAKSRTADEMFSLFNGVKDADQQNAIAKSIIGDLANANPHAAMEWASQLSDKKTRANSLVQIIATVAKSDFETAKAYYLALDDPAAQFQAVSDIAFSKLDKRNVVDIAETVALIDAIDDAGYREKALGRLGNVAGASRSKNSLQFADAYISMIESRNDLSRDKKDKLIRQALPKRLQGKKPKT